MNAAKAVRPPAPGSRPQVLVLGGGFAGIDAAQKLRKHEVDVVIVDGHDYHTFQPLLYQVATDCFRRSPWGTRFMTCSMTSRTPGSI
jgi:NADPH-dependent 2,4-dienoyl-CoA reductase/sulfur reductase-like enzyme